MALVEIPQQYTHSAMIEDTAKGIRVNVHIYTNSLESATNEAIKLYQSIKQKAKMENIPVAPMEIVK